jgi:hypothetical protein
MEDERGATHAGEKRTLGEAWGFNPKDERESKFLAG